MRSWHWLWTCGIAVQVRHALVPILDSFRLCLSTSLRLSLFLQCPTLLQHFAGRLTLLVYALVVANTECRNQKVSWSVSGVSIHPTRSDIYNNNYGLHDLSQWCAYVDMYTVCTLHRSWGISDYSLNRHDERTVFADGVCTAEPSFKWLRKHLGASTKHSI